MPNLDVINKMSAATVRKFSMILSLSNEPRNGVSRKK